MLDHHHQFPRIALVLLVAVAACESPVSPADDVPVTRIEHTAFSGFDTPQRLIIRSQNEWEDLWPTLFHRRLDVPALPNIDFTQNMVIVAGNGLKPTSGYAVSIAAASTTRRTMTVTVRSVSPGSNCVTFQVITSPIDLVLLPRREKVTFVEQAETILCS